MLWLGRVCVEKGLSAAIAAFRLALKMAPFLRLWVVGPLEDRRLLPLLHTAELSAGGRIVYKGYVEDPWNVFEPDIVLHTPIYDAFPRAVLEAMSAGVPTVATAVGGIPEMLEHGRTGLLVDPDSPSSIAEALVRLAMDARLRQALGQRAKEKYEGFFTIEHMATRISALYREVAAATS